MSIGAQNSGNRRRATAGLLVAACLFGCGADGESPGPVVVDADGPRAAWAKAVADMNGDGRPDILVGGHERRLPGLGARVTNKLGLTDPEATAGELVWYENPGWRRHLISDRHRIRTDIAAGDVDGDGDVDVVAPTDDGVVLFRAPDWAEERLPTGDRSKFHDVALADLDADGDLDIVLRNQSLFGYRDGDRLLLLRQDRKGWREHEIAIEHGEGLHVDDIDGDGLPDIVVNGAWLRNTGRVTGRWPEVSYAPAYEWQDVVLFAADINADGRKDILASPAEPEGARHRVSWFEAPASARGDWVEHIIEDDVEAIHHALGAGDFDGDGDVDVFTAEMNQGPDPDEVRVYLREPDGWRRVVLGTSGLHNLQVADFDGDGDVEFAGANWEFPDRAGPYPVTLWDDAMLPAQPGAWQRTVIGDNGSRRNLFVRVADLDGDGLPDVAAGPAWFRNPGERGASWKRIEFGSGMATVLLLADVDGDDDNDVIGCDYDGRLAEPGAGERLSAKLSGAPYPGSSDCAALRWARNDGSGSFEVSGVVATLEGDYPQGVTLHTGSDGPGLVVSWHRSGLGLQRYALPDAPSLDAEWPVTDRIAFSEDEQLTSVDLDGDGVEELVTGTHVLSAADGWRPRRIVDMPGIPDRHHAGDVDGDGSIDLVVGAEAIGVPGDLVWLEGLDSKRGPRAGDVVDRPFGPMSLGVADFTGDGRADLVVGEHRPDAPKAARLLLYAATPDGGFLPPRVIGRGDEHHDGAVPVDIDGDGDTDVVSIGWTHSDVLVYENPGAR